MPRASAGWAALTAGCVWIDAQEDERLDNDGDRFPFASDCNDQDPEIGDLPSVPVERVLGCGDRVEDTLGGPDVLGFTQCLHPLLVGDLVVAPGVEGFWELRVDTSTDVLVTLDTTHGFGLESTGFGDNGDVPLLANRGRSCAVELCVPAMPSAPPDWLEPDADGPTPWAPRVRVHAEPGEVWSLVVSGAEGSDYGLDVACEG